MFRRLALFGLLVLSISAVSAQKIIYQTDASTDAITSLKIEGDATGMNWLVRTDGTQYAWIGNQFQWGTLRNLDGSEVQGLSCKVTRRYEGNDLVETYIIRNTSHANIDLSQIQIYTPWNDNYPDANTCRTLRCNAHVWAAERCTYTYAIRMGGKGPHMGMMLEEGSIGGYAISERGMDKGASNTRGIISLIPETFTLMPGRVYMLRWRIFSFDNEEDFFNKMVAKGGVRVRADKYVAKMDENISVQISTRERTWTETYPIRQTGEQRIEINGGKGRRTHIEVFGLLSIAQLLESRAQYIMDYQQFKDAGSEFYGAYLPYDRSSSKMVQSWKAENQRSDMNAGRERLGMGVFMALYAQFAKKHPSDSYIDQHFLSVSLDLYAKFVRQLQSDSYTTYSSPHRNDKVRIYNYPWVSHFYCEMFKLTQEKQFLVDAYRTQMAQFRDGGFNFYAIDIPAIELCKLLSDNVMEHESDSLLSNYRQLADRYVSNGLHFPKFEVNYEQSIVAPAFEFLCEIYLLTREERYLNCAKEMLPALEAFNGHQPSCHLNEIAIRHWDGFWFGLPQTWGDTFPHYWSCITAQGFAKYAECTGDARYRQRAKDCLLGNLLLFDSQGFGSCAFQYPNYVNGKSARFANPCANDQDWALVYLLMLKDSVF